MTLKEFFLLLRSDLVRLDDPLHQRDDAKVNYLNLLNPRFFPVFFIRLARYCHKKKLLYPFAVFFTWLNFFIFGVECTPRCEIGYGLLLPHTSGTVIGAAEIGHNVTIFQGVTLGAVSLDMHFDVTTRPVIRNGVIVGAGAKVLGGITIDDFSKIGANSVVLNSIPANCTVVGIPGKVVVSNA